MIINFKICIINQDTHKFLKIFAEPYYHIYIYIYIYIKDIKRMLLFLIRTILILRRSRHFFLFMLHNKTGVLKMHPS